jgi:hypothetical protein
MDLDYTRALYPPGGEHLGKEPTELTQDVCNLARFFKVVMDGPISFEMGWGFPPCRKNTLVLALCKFSFCSDADQI